jgi:RNA polymerase sigma-70 factor (ECF subfamily)
MVTQRKRTDNDDSADSALNELLRQASRGDDQLFSDLLSKYRRRLHKIIELRLDQRLRGRIDPSDVIQEAYLEASQRLASYLDDRKMPFFLWLRFLTLQKLMLAHRQHLGTKARDATRDIPLYGHPHSEPSSTVLAEQLLDHLTSPSQVALRTERMVRVQQALARLDPIDVEVLVLRHFEELTHAEIGQLLGIKRAGASHRYQRALKNIRSTLENMPGGMEGIR